MSLALGYWNHRYLVELSGINFLAPRIFSSSLIMPNLLSNLFISFAKVLQDVVELLHVLRSVLLGNVANQCCVR